ILELGAGNGYFIPLMLKHFSGQIPNRIVITDQSEALLAIARKSFLINDAEYHHLDIRDDFPFGDAEFDLILTTMVFNEITRGGLFRALKECYRVLTDQGIMIATVLHPDFILNLDKRGMLQRNQKGHLTMPGTKNLRLPVVKRKMGEYFHLLEQTNFQFEVEDVYPTKEVLNEKKGLQYASNNPIAAIFVCKKKIK
ncbi:MAG: class I SAM-dependent methyltransferase, partial [Candidatus Heimdallarchaeota archaeon]|nr:class I SAM-dependent methyltransferase [Candidatus Heimdallarchaeota archaeon]